MNINKSNSGYSGEKFPEILLNQNIPRSKLNNNANTINNDITNGSYLVMQQNYLPPITKTNYMQKNDGKLNYYLLANILEVIDSNIEFLNNTLEFQKQYNRTMDMIASFMEKAIDILQQTIDKLNAQFVLLMDKVTRGGLFGTIIALCIGAIISAITLGTATGVVALIIAGIIFADTLVQIGGNVAGMVDTKSARNDDSSIFKVSNYGMFALVHDKDTAKTLHDSLLFVGMFTGEGVTVKAAVETKQLLQATIKIMQMATKLSGFIMMNINSKNEELNGYAMAMNMGIIAVAIHAIMEISNLNKDTSGKIMEMILLGLSGIIENALYMKSLSDKTFENLNEINGSKSFSQITQLFQTLQLQEQIKIALKSIITGCETNTTTDYHTDADLMNKRQGNTNTELDKLQEQIQRYLQELKQSEDALVKFIASIYTVIHNAIK